MKYDYLVILLVAFAVLGLVTGSNYMFRSTATAGLTATVTSTVTAQSISVSVADGSVAYGVLADNTSKGTNTSDMNDTQTATNNGNVAEDFNIKGQNSANWTLASSTGSDQYVHKFCAATCDSPPTNYTALTTNYQALGTNIAANGTKTFDLRITTPNPSTNFTQQSVDVLVQAVLH